MKRRILMLTLIVAAAAVLIAAAPASAQHQRDDLVGVKPAEKAGLYSYAVKFVCGFNRSNVGILADPDAEIVGGEATVKIGNYATDVNIFNPGNDIEITKKVLVLVRNGAPVGREPAVVGPSGNESIGLPFCSATFDDCNKILQIAGINPGPGVPGLFIGFLVIESPIELDVTAVYTAELCSDFVTVGASTMCQTPPGAIGFAAYGAGISIDVEQIRGRYVLQ